MSAGMDQAMKRLDGPRLARPHVLALALGAALLAAAPATPGPPPQSPSRAALDFHKRALVVDGHVHLINAVFNQGIDPWKPQETGTFDYARARKGGLDGAVNGFMQAASWGTPDKILRGLEERRRIIGDFELNVAFRFGGTPYEVAERGLKLFAKEVLPALKSPSFTSVREAAE